MRAAKLVTVLAAAVAVTASCTSLSEPEPSMPGTSDATPAAADPRANSVPVDGDESVPLDWTLPDGVDGDDPVVEVARRTAALVLLAQLSPKWNDTERLQKLAGALTDGSELSISPARIAEWAADDKDGIDDPIRLLVQPPRTDGKTAVVFLCMDAAAAAPGDLASSPEPGSGSGIVRLDLGVEDGYWRTTSYDQNTSAWTHDEFQVCKDF